MHAQQFLYTYVQAKQLSPHSTYGSLYQVVPLSIHVILFILSKFHISFLAPLSISFSHNACKLGHDNLPAAD